MVWVSLFVFVGAWAAVAPQAMLSLGERLRFSFEAITFVCVGVAATSGLRRRVSLIESADLPLRKIDEAVARIGFDCVRAGQELLPAIPFFIFLAALEVASPFEVLAALGTIALAMIAAGAITNDRWAVSLAVAAGFLFFTWRRNPLEMALCGLVGLHVVVKACVAWDAIERARRRQRNLCDEAMAPVDPLEILDPYRKSIWQKYRPAIMALAGINVSLLLYLGGTAVPITWEQKFAVGVALIGGVVLLFIDASALVWCGLLRGVTVANTNRAVASLFATVVGIPWAVAWIFSALHSGEAVTFNEAAAYFVLWSVLGGAISWISRGNAKARLQSDLRTLLSEG